MLFHPGALSDGQRNALTLVTMTDQFMNAPVASDLQAIEKFAAL